VEATNNKDQLIQIFEEDDHAAFLLYESGSFKKAIDDMEDKEMIITELRDGVLYSSWAAILQLQQGLHNLNALQMIKENPDIMKSFFCYKAPNLSSSTSTLNFLFNNIIMIVHQLMIHNTTL
jgi:hypothetical protein